jgi:hypothetical protein
MEAPVPRKVTLNMGNKIKRKQGRKGVSGEERA